MMQQSELSPDEVFLRLPGVMAKVARSKTEIYRRIAKGTFPAGRRQSHRVTIWLRSEITQWQIDELGLSDEERDLIG